MIADHHFVLIGEFSEAFDVGHLPSVERAVQPRLCATVKK